MVPDLGEVWQVQFANGLTVLVKPRSNTPMVFIKAALESGFEHDPPGKSGLAHWMGEMLDEGTRNPVTGEMRTHEEIAEQIESVGGELCTKENGIEIKVMSRDFQMASGLLRDLLLYPSFPAERVEFVRSQILASIDQRDDDPVRSAHVLFRRTVYAGHPLGRTREGERETVANITREDLIAHHRRFVRPDRVIVVVVGGVDPEQVLYRLRSLFSEGWERPLDGEIPPVVHPGASSRRMVYCTRKTHQVNMVIGHEGIRRDFPDYEALKVLEYVAYKGPGFTDRLSKIVRDQHGLAYEVWGDMTGSAEEVPGLWMIYVGTEPANMKKALELTREVIRQIVEEGPSPSEVDDARLFLMRHFVFQWETVDALAHYLVDMYRFRLGTDYPRRFFERVQGLSVQDLQAAARKVFHLDRLVTVVVGPVDESGRLVEEIVEA